MLQQRPRSSSEGTGSTAGGQKKARTGGVDEVTAAYFAEAKLQREQMLQFMKDSRAQAQEEKKAFLSVLGELVGVLKGGQ
jgi:hypothetical protein